MEQKKKCGARTKFTLEKGIYILEKLRETWSPKQIAGRLFPKERLSFKTIYCWIYSGLVEANSGLLRQKGKCQKPRETRGRFNVRLPISKRSSDVKGGQTFGHWELDTVVSGRGTSIACVATKVSFLSRCTDGKSVRSIDEVCDSSITSFLHVGNVPNYDDRSQKRV